MKKVRQKTLNGKKRTENKKRDITKVRIVQLAVSTVLFVAAFLGRGAIPGDVVSLIKNDTDFKAVFEYLSRSDLQEEGTFLGVLLGKRGEDEAKNGIREEDISADNDGGILIPGGKVTLLSETSGHGLEYYRENGLREKAGEDPGESNDGSVETSEPELTVDTACAQAYSQDGEALPSNVSFQFYELGLEKTVCPILGPVTSNFGFRASPFTGGREFHLAMDIGAAEGTKIGAFSDGVIRYIGEDDSFGLYLMIDHDNGVSSFYAHCSKLLVQKGDYVECGETIALVGQTGSATGPHLHFTLLKDNIRLDPAYYIDPEKLAEV